MRALLCDNQEQVKRKARIYRDMMCGVSHTEMGILSVIADYYINELAKLNVSIATNNTAGCHRTILRVTGPDLDKATPILCDMVKSFMQLDHYNLRTENGVRILFGLEPKRMPYTDFKFELKNRIRYYGSKFKRQFHLVWH
jgi:hypothetical protein